MPTDLAAFTRDLASTFRSAMERAGLEFDVESSAAREPVYRRSGHVGEDRAQPALQRVQVHAARRESRCASREPTRHACSKLSDTGVGSAGSRDAAAVRAVPSRRGHAGAHARGLRHRPGAGAGARKLHGGTIDVDEQVGQGTTFTVRVPFGSAHLPPERIEPRQRRRPPRRIGAQAFVAGGAALAAGSRTAERGRRSRARRRAASMTRRFARRSGRASCWPTTTPTCVLPERAARAALPRGGGAPMARPRSRPRAATAGSDR